MIRKPELITFWRGRLPHWEVVDGRYFVTLHLSGAIPAAGEDRIRSLARQHESLPQHAEARQLALQRNIYTEMEDWLDRSEFAPHFLNREIAQIVLEAIAFRQGKDWNMLEFVVMPNHLHLFFELCRPGLKSCLEQFKRWTGHQAAKLLKLDGASFWQDEWFDHWSRSDEEGEKIALYIRRNPEKALLVEHYLKWPYGSWHSGVVDPLL